MNNKQNEFIIGLTMSIATLIVIIGILILGKSNFFVTGLPINLIVNDAKGIGEGDEVFFKGLKVGTVNKAEITDGKVVLKLKINGVEKIPNDSKFEIKDLSLIGGKIVEISSGMSKSYLVENATVVGVSKGGGMESLISDVKNLEPKINKILSNIDKLTSDKTQNDVALILQGLSETINSTKRVINVDLHNTLTNLNEVTTENKDDISKLIKSLSESSNNLSDFLNKSSSAAVKIDSLVAKLNEGKGSMGNIMQNDSLYKNINQTIISVDSLVSDIKENPDKYINVSVF